MAIIERISLFQRNAATNTDKQYDIQLEQHGDSYTVVGYNGRRGASLTARPQANCPTDLAGAKKYYDDFVIKQQKKSYTPDTSGVAYVGTELAGRDTGLRPQLLNEIDDAHAQTLIADDAWGMMEKIDGERRMIRKRGDVITGANRKGLEVPLPQSIADALSAVGYDFTIDGEIIGDKIFVLDLFDCNTEDFRSHQFFERHQLALGVVRSAMDDQHVGLVPIYLGKKTKSSGYADLAGYAEGVVFKRLGAPYSEGRPASGGNALKRKFWNTLTAIVSSHNAKNSVGLSLLDPTGNEVFVGNLTVKANQSTPPIGATVEVRYLYVSGQGGSLYQSELLGVRDDIERDECTLDQVKYKGT